jgi:hypothetical protein
VEEEEEEEEEEDGEVVENRAARGMLDARGWTVDVCARLASVDKSICRCSIVASVKVLA